MSDSEVEIIEPVEEFSYTDDSKAYYDPENSPEHLKEQYDMFKGRGGVVYQQYDVVLQASTNKCKFKCKKCSKLYTPPAGNSQTSNLLRHFRLCNEQSGMIEKEHEEKFKAQQAKALEKKRRVQPTVQDLFGNAIRGVKPKEKRMTIVDYNQPRLAMAWHALVSATPPGQMISDSMLDVVASFIEVPAACILTLEGYSRDTIVQDMLKVKTDFTSHMKDTLKDQHFLSGTSDLWTKPNKGGSYSAFTVSYVNKNYEVIEMLIGFSKCYSRHTGVHLSELWTEECKTYDIIEKLDYMTLDGASNNGTGVQSFNDINNTNVGQLWCILHIGNLCGKDALKEDFNGLLERVRGLIKQVNNCEAARLVLEERALALGYDISHLSTDMPVRWLSSFRAVVAVNLFLS
eukprot:TRINITY_DN1680_c0_g1_i8.p1 TRINITY_DN1680_c0_g1~~TRINITY_DN1680_c0_g1_i8.p1  ORF type:complete len:402 (-),score=86.86 TRINITY_DN1680_c0_g1_i8:108-1313(-)